MRKSDFAEKHSRTADAFSVPTNGSNVQKGGAPQQPHSQQRGLQTVPTSSASAESGSLSEAYVQSILASVPETPSFIKIVEKNTLQDTTLQQASPPAIDTDQDMDQDMEQDDLDNEGDAGEEDDQQYDVVEGFKVPVPVPVSTSSKTQLRPPGVSRGALETRAISDRMANVTLSDDQVESSANTHRPNDQTDTTLMRSMSSMSMDTQP
jgi:hypothetical protein